MVVIVVVFKVLQRKSSTAAGVQNVDIPVREGLRGFLSLDRVRRSVLWSSSLTVLLEVFKIFTSVRALQLHPLVVRMRLFQGIFALFPGPKKSAKVRARSRSELAAHSSSSTPGAYGVVSSLEELVQEEKEEHQDAQEEEENGVWNWHRRTRASGYTLPPLPPE